MKSAKQMGIILVVVVMLMGAYHQGQLVAEDAVSPAKVGVINVTQVLENCQLYKSWQEQMQVEQAPIRQELDRMQNEKDALEAQLKVRKPGSEEYLKTLTEYTNTDAMLEAKKKMNSIRAEEQIRQWTDETYAKLVRVTEELAKKKGLDFIMTTETMDTEDMTFRDLLLSLRTKKFIYFDSKYDLTAEATAALDAAK